jgi:auxin efflux carrier family protein
MLLMKKGKIMIKIFLMQIVGFIVGVVPWLRRLMIGSNAPLHVIEDSASMLGYASQINHLYDFGITYIRLHCPIITCSDAAIPTITLIMGANLLKGKTDM